MYTRSIVNHRNTTTIIPGPGAIVRKVRFSDGWEGSAIQLSRNDVIFLKKTGVIREETNGSVVWPEEHGKNFKLPMVRQLREILKDETKSVRCVSNILYLKD